MFVNVFTTQNCILFQWKVVVSPNIPFLLQFFCSFALYLSRLFLFFFWTAQIRSALFPLFDTIDDTNALCRSLSLHYILCWSTVAYTSDCLSPSAHAVVSPSILLPYHINVTICSWLAQSIKLDLFLNKHFFVVYILWYKMGIVLTEKFHRVATRFEAFGRSRQ